MRQNNVVFLNRELPTNCLALFPMTTRGVDESSGTFRSKGSVLAGTTPRLAQRAAGCFPARDALAEVIT